MAVDAPGVTDDTIRVGGVASVTNPLGGGFGGNFDGVKAYFEMVNDNGGVHGRSLELVAEHDDQVSQNDAKIQQLLTQDDIFAVLPVASLLFTGADDLAEASVPTFGWTINPEWEGTEEEPKENLFGQAGSALCITCASPLAPFVANELDVDKVGLLAYNVPQSADCATGMEASFEEYSEEGSATVEFVDRSLAYGTTNLSVQVSQMKDEGVDLVLACMDLQGSVTLAREMGRQSLDAVHYMVNAYDQDLLDDYGDLFQGSVVTTFFAPFNVEEPPPGLETYLEWMERTDTEADENTMNGWLSAALFVEGLEQAGPDFSRAKVIDALNSESDWDADGLLAGVDWTKEHAEPRNPACMAFSLIEDDEFVPAFGEPGKPFICTDRSQEGVPQGTPSE